MEPVFPNFHPLEAENPPLSVAGVTPSRRGSAPAFPVSFWKSVLKWRRSHQKGPKSFAPP
ncbi:MAG: hypothetical protein LBR53_03220 [Deltaproteobacteria bacterium]|nr:hypothetical protein [Deltaproteobacteria bacterium]